MRLAIAVVLFAAACGDNLEPFAGLVQVSPSESPFSPGCAHVDQPGTAYASEEVEPFLAADAADPAHLVAVWQQDRWSNGGANGTGAAVSRDGGATWQRTLPAFTACAGGTYQRASDAWAAITADGSAWAASIAFDATSNRSGVLAARSPDGGRTWDAPATLIADDDADVFNDKDALTADPTIPGQLYVVWDRLTGLSEPTQPIGTGPAMLARFAQGAWQPARPIFDPGVDAQTLGNVLVVLGDGTLVDVFDLITMTSSASPHTVAAAIRSTDHGDTWSLPITIAPVGPAGIRGVRTGAGLVAAAARGSAIDVTWEDRANDHEVIVLSRSLDGGLTWSVPQAVNGAPGVDAFAPGVAIAADGTVGVFYYDLRGTTGTDLHATPWLATSSDGGLTFAEHPLAEAFPLAPARLGSGAFLGDYEGIVAVPGHFVPLFAAAVIASDPTDVFVPAPE